MRILVAHTNEDVRAVLARALSDCGLDVDSADSAAVALETARRVAFDLVVLGAGARAEGIDVCSTLKRELDRYVPILLLVPEGAAPVRRQALAAGADECLESPVDTDDVVARVRSFLRIKALQDELRVVDRMRHELEEAVSHDLRSPLVGIIGAVQNMLGGYAGPTTPQQREYLMMIGRTASQFHERMERIQRLARLDSKRVEIRAESLDLEAETRQVAAPLVRRLEEKLIALEVEAVGGTPPARAEGRLVREALGHLLDNAVKFSPPNSTIRVRIDEVVENESFYVRWEVRDEGIGIRRSDFERIFHRFEQVTDAQDPSEPQGTGLGLAIAKEIVEAHGGRVELESEPDRGSRFAILLPAAGERAASA